MGEISEIVDAILYLDSANFVTGEILHVDGGQAAVITQSFFEESRHAMITKSQSERIQSALATLQ
jgi:hypothetical protein